MRKVAIPRFGESVAPCFEYSATMAIFSIEGREVVDQIDVPIRSQIAFDRVRLMRDHQIDTVICGGVNEVYEDMLRAHGVKVISWVSGNVEDLLRDYLDGRLIPGTARLGWNPDDDAMFRTRPSQETP